MFLVWHDTLAQRKIQASSKSNFRLYPYFLRYSALQVHDSPHQYQGIYRSHVIVTRVNLCRIEQGGVMREG